MTLPAATVRALGPGDVAAFIEMRRLGLDTEPHAFGASPEDDLALSPDFVRRAIGESGQVILGAFAPHLVGTAGVRRLREAKSRHKAMVWGVYVSPVCRGQGVGRQLLEHARQWAREQPGLTHLHLVVSTRTPAARALYEAVGFRVWGTEPSALFVNGEFVDDDHMTCDLSG